MFELEILELLKKLKNTSDEYELKKIRKSICNLIKENPQKFEKFTQMEALDNQTIKILNECELIEAQEDQNKISNEPSDFEIIKKYYLKWLDIYQKNNNVVNIENEKIIENIINFYVQNRFEVILQLLKTNDSQEFGNFKNMLKNYLRKYFAEKINNYYKSENYTNLNYFQKRRKNKELLLILEWIGNYEFEKIKLEEILK